MFIDTGKPLVPDKSSVDDVVVAGVEAKEVAKECPASHCKCCPLAGASDPLSLTGMTYGGWLLWGLKL